MPTEMACNNQCSGHGDCWFGFCQCHAGYWGHDCAHRDPGVQPAPSGGLISCKACVPSTWQAWWTESLLLPDPEQRRTQPAAVTHTRAGPCCITARVDCLRLAADVQLLEQAPRQTGCNTPCWTLLLESAMPRSLP